MQTLQMHACGNTCTCAHWLQTARYPGEEGCQILQQDLTWGHITLKKKITHKFCTPAVFASKGENKYV